jgi:hypothetical protein
MRFVAAVFSVVVVLASTFTPHEVHAQQEEVIPFTVAQVDRFPAAGFYVFRDETEWAEKYVSLFPNNSDPPPPPDLSDSLIIAISYGMAGCTETGGELEQIVMIDDELRLILGHVYRFNLVCMAELPRWYFYRVSHADVPPEAVFTFVPAELPYDVDRERWYPLSVGNAWHFQEDHDRQLFDRVEVVEEEIDVEGETWYRIVEAFSSDTSRPGYAPRYLRWSDDAFLLTSTDPTAYVDTVHAGFLESPFLVDVPRRHVPLAAGGSRSVYVGKNAHRERFDGFVALWDCAQEIWYAQGIGPVGGLVAAIIDGEHYEDTSLIQTVLSSTRPDEQVVNGRIEVYPHPATAGSIIAFVPERTGKITFALYDLLGREVMSSRASVVAGTEWRSTLEAELPPGAYFARITSETGVVAKRSIIVAR